MIISFHQFSERFSKLHPFPVYLLSGEESFFLNEGIKMIKKRFLQGDMDDFNFSGFHAEDVEPARVVEVAETLPVLAEYRVVVVQNVDKWTSRERKTLTSYVSRPSPSTCLVLTSTKLDEKDRLTGEVNKNGVVVNCKSLTRDRLAAWVRKRLKKAGKNIDDHALYTLIEFTGNDMRSLDNDMEKLILYTSDRQDVSVEDVVKVSSAMRSISVFEVVNTLMAKRLKDALFYLRRALVDGEPPMRILYFITREYRMMIRAKLFMESGKSPGEAAKMSGVPYFKHKEFLERVRSFSLDELYRIYERLFDADMELKNNIQKPAQVLETLFLSLLNQGQKSYAPYAD